MTDGGGMYLLIRLTRCGRDAQRAREKIEAMINIAITVDCFVIDYLKR
jgi:hypothetical protein